jgi:serine/threonine protein kinase
MSPERWKKIGELCDYALDYDKSEREELLKEACGDDESLFVEVKALLVKMDEGESFLDNPPFQSIFAGLGIEGNGTSFVGKKIGQYEILKELGRGGVGQVFLARDSDLGRQVALKFLHKSLLGNSQEQLRRFDLEAQTLSSLNHPNILTVYGTGRFEDLSYIVSEFVDGVTLREHIKHKFKNEISVLNIAIQIALALQTAHNSEIIHRDVKPENVIVRSDGIVKVLDFGLAKIIKNDPLGEVSEYSKSLSNQTNPNFVMGTPGYMSPEQLRGKPIDKRTDIWSFGVLLYEMLTGELPFKGVNESDLIASICGETPTPLSKFEENIPPIIQKIIDKALAKNVEERYQSIEDLYQDLLRAFPILFTQTDNGESDFNLHNLLKTNVGSSAIWLPEIIAKTNTLHSLPDLITPGLPPETLLKHLTVNLGEFLAKHFGQLSKLSISAVEDGDFGGHVVLGKQIVDASQGYFEIESVGFYFVAEGFRLQADLESNQAEKELLLKQAAENYELSLEKNPKDPRSLRGLARVYEVRGNFDSALKKFKKAESLAQLQLLSENPPELQLHLSHEILRITRHYINCILEIMATNPQSIWHQEHKRQELEGYLRQSENLHREKMQLFRGQQQWYRIEWFMALVFFGKTWGRLGNVENKNKCLIEALTIRRKMIIGFRELTEVEKSNIKWWISVALSSQQSSIKGVMNLANVMGRGDSFEILRTIDAIVFPHIPYWEQ